jgi:hypothetical protein
MVVVPVLALLGVELLPGTGAVVRLQLRAAVCGPLVGMWAGRGASGGLARAAAGHPDDLLLQLGWAAREGRSGADTGREATDPAVLAALDQLEPSFSDQPSLQAAVLRELSRGDVNLSAREGDLTALTGPPSTAPYTGDAATPVSPAALGEWDRAVAAGERLDPDNAFFPMMEAVGLFAARQDDAACAALQRAAALPHFDDYFRDEVLGGWRLDSTAAGIDPGVVSRVSRYAATRILEYRPLRDAAHLAVLCAVEREQSGNAEGGFAIRRAVQRDGDRMRVDASTIVTSAAGRSVAGTSWLRPGGEAPLTGLGRNAAVIAQDYETYLSRIGHADEAAWVEHDIAASQEMKRITNIGTASGPISVEGIVPLGIAMASSIVVLGNLLAMLVTGGFALRLAQRTRAAEDSPTDGSGLRRCAIVAAAVVAWLGLGAGCGLGTLNAALASPSGADPLVTLIASVIFAVLFAIAPGAAVAVVTVRNARRADSTPSAALREFASVSVPITAALSLLYCCSVGVYAAKEAAARNALDLLAQHEGRYYAKVAGIPWPTFGPEDGQ